MDKLILIFALAPLVGATGAFYYYGDESLLLRVIGLLVALIVSLVIAYQTAPGKTAWAFVRDSRTEVRKVVWPTRKETAQTTLFVIVAVIIMGIFFFLLDMLLGWAVRLLTG
ncbi:MAG: preprotein translocase subunit SecE [Gammaproteobacteria bacterium]